MLADLRLRAVGGAIVGACLTAWKPFGLVGWPTIHAPVRRRALFLSGSALLCLLQWVTVNVRQLLGSPSLFGQKVTAGARWPPPRLWCRHATAERTRARTH
jgi:hypothetical protein